MSDVLGDNTWVAGVHFLAKGTRREDIAPDVADLVGCHLWVGEEVRPNVTDAGQALSGLKDNVHIDGVMYAKGSVPPPEVAAKVGDHLWVGGRPPVATTEDAGLGSDSGQSSTAGAVLSAEIPPKGGPGSGKSAWADYARAHNISVEPGSSREDIIDQLDDAGIPTE